MAELYKPILWRVQDGVGNVQLFSSYCSTFKVINDSIYFIPTTKLQAVDAIHFVHFRLQEGAA